MEPDSTQHQPVMDRRYPGEVTTLAQCRADVAAAVRGVAGLRDRREALLDVVERLVSVVNELAANAIAASPGRQYRVVVRVAASETCEVTVYNEKPVSSIPARSEWRAPGPTARGGRGLAIVSQLADRVWHREEGGTVVVGARVEAPAGG